MASFKTRIVFLLTGRNPETEKKIDVLEGFNRELEAENMVMNRFFWKLYEMAVTAHDLESLAKAAERLGKLYSNETGFRYQPFSYDQLCKKDSDNGTDADTE